MSQTWLKVGDALSHTLFYISPLLTFSSTLILHEVFCQTWLEVGDALSHALHLPGSLVPQDGGEEALGIRPAQGVGISVAHRGGVDLQ